MKYHAGIRIDQIPAEGGGGLIFAVGTAAIFMLAFPQLLPVGGSWAASCWRPCCTACTGNQSLSAPAAGLRPAAAWAA
jgi:hypothetical protein